jgi:N-6 DNA Methylase
MRRSHSGTLRVIREAVDALSAVSRATTEPVVASFDEGRRLVLSQVLGREARVRGLSPVPFSLGPIGPQRRGTLRSRRATLTAFDDRLEAITQGRPIPTEAIATAFESLYESAHSALSPASAVVSIRRDRGMFLTPPDLAGFLTKLTLDPLLNQWEQPSPPTIVDPAVGAGIFLLSALPVLAEERLRLEPTMAPNEARREVAARLLFGVDRDPLAVGIARNLLWLEVGDPDWDGHELGANVRHGDSIAEPLATWAAWFPEVMQDRGGFDAVLSNPPWGTIKPVRSEMTARLARGTGSATAAGPTGELDSAWAAHVTTAREYRNQLDRTGSYSHQGAVAGGGRRGDAELYKYFAERAFQLLGPLGHAGLVLPAGFHRAEGAGALRSLYLRNGTFRCLFEFQNRRRVFPIHGMFRFLLLTYQRGGPGGIGRLAFGLTEVAQARLAATSKDPVELSADALRRIGGRVSAVPEVSSRAAVDLLLKLNDAHPPLTAPAGLWNVSFRRELDMTTDAPAFVHVEAARAAGWRRLKDGSWKDEVGNRYAPVYEGRMVHQFDHAAKGYRSGRARRANWVALAPGAKVIDAQWVIEEREAVRRGAVFAFRAGFCDVTGHANERTVLAGLIPPNAACGNKVPTCRFDSDDQRLHLLWLAVANSFVVDWIIRRWISTTLNFFYWDQVPFPRLDPDSEVGAELVLASAALSDVSIDGWRLRRTRPITDLRERARLRARIDALVARTYSLNAKDLKLILADFPLLDRRQPAAGPRLSATCDLVLEAFARARRDGLDSLAPKLRPAVSKVVPFVPSEVAPSWLQLSGDATH